MTELRERAAIVALVRHGGRPWHEFSELIDGAGSALAVLRGEGPDDQDEGTLFHMPSTPVADDPVLHAIEDEIRGWESEGMRLLTVLDHDYPTNLRTIHDRPPLLFVRGSLDERDERSVAVVGTRKATDEGLRIARHIAAEMVDHGFVVVSGLADGIDTAAHKAALTADGRTVAVIGTGLLKSYPAKNAGLQRRLSEESAVISQFWPDQPPTPKTFPMRNVVMSGLALATIVVEASRTSGAKMQARFALRHGRPVFLLSRLLAHEWAQEFAERPGVYVVTSTEDIAEQVGRLAEPDTLAPDPFALA